MCSQTMSSCRRAAVQINDALPYLAPRGFRALHFTLLSDKKQSQRLRTRAQMSEELSANSLQCDICLVQLRNTAAAQIHAEKTDHQSFSESTTVIKPLTEEEKKAKLQDLREKLAAKRKLEAEGELENLKKNAVIERKKTQESSEVIEALQRKEELKAIAAKKKEKEDDLKAKQSSFTLRTTSS